MSSSQTRQRVADARVDALPLRSLTALWVALGVLTLALVGALGRGLWAKSSARAAASQPAQPAGPTKRQVRERQEHIALTERALELARKEQKAATAAAPSASSTAPVPTAASDGSTPLSKTAVTRSPSTASSSASSPAAPASDKPAAAKPASSGLDAMRADIASQFE
jgi:FtsZ-interacting cell division protein ZipA